MYKLTVPKKFNIHFPIVSYVKTMTCDGGHLEFLIYSKQNVNFVEDIAAFKFLSGFIEKWRVKPKLRMNLDEIS